ncbi:hypothetical protein MKW92_029184 [Papaver armeniacum]|nr:hypothetical protein MKW92_029184 [Papaver armeniacum]
MIRALRKFGGSACVYSPHSPSANPIPKPNPSLSPTHSSSSSLLLNRVRHSRVYRTEQYVHPYYFYCDTEDFKEMLIEYKSGNRKMYPYIFEALTARHSEHGEDDKKLMKELGVLSKGDDKKEVHRENCAGRDEGEWKEVKSTTGHHVKFHMLFLLIIIVMVSSGKYFTSDDVFSPLLVVTGDSRAFSRLVASTISIVITENKLFSSRFMIKDPVEDWPLIRMGSGIVLLTAWLFGSDFFLFGRTGGEVTYALGKPDNIEVKCCIIPLSHYLVQNKAAHGRSLLLNPGSLD